MTISLKSGAPASSAGKLAVRRWIGVGFLVLDWRESDGPEMAASAIASIGSRLLERLVAGQIRGTTRRRLAPSGVICTTRIVLHGRLIATAAQD